MRLYTHPIIIMTLEEIFTLENLNNAFYQGSKISQWKETTQRYKSNLLLNNEQLRQDILNGTYKTSPTYNFTLRERGKVRDIEAPAQRDRVVHKVLCHKVLIPYLTKTLIYDTYASLKNRGTSFARKRLDILLRRFINKYDEGYVLQIDIKKYFESIDHEILKTLVHEKVKEPKEVLDFLDYIIDTSSNSDKGLNLGSEAPQILAIYYLSKIDNYIKTVKGVKYYGRYMDDMFIFSNSKEELRLLLEDIKKELKTLKLEINDSKTHIVKMSCGFTFMQIKYSIDGKKIVKRPTRQKITREKHRLKKFKKQYDDGLMSELEIRNCYKSWRYSVLKDCNACYKTIAEMDKLYNDLFPIREPKIEYTRSELVRHILLEEGGIEYEIYCPYG